MVAVHLGADGFIESVYEQGGNVLGVYYVSTAIHSVVDTIIGGVLCFRGCLSNLPVVHEGCGDVRLLLVVTQYLLYGFRSAGYSSFPSGQ